MSYTELKQPLWLKTPLGVGTAIAVIDYGPEHDLLWVVGDDDTGQIWTWANPEVRMIPNKSLQAKRAEGATTSGDHGEIIRST